MPRFVYDPATDKLVPSEDYHLEKFYRLGDKRMMNGNQAVTLHYIADEMPPTRHMSNGKLYTSKKKFRDETRARGCIEVGDQTEALLKPRKPIKLDRRKRREAIRKAIYDIKNGYDVKKDIRRDLAKV